MEIQMVGLTIYLKGVLDEDADLSVLLTFESPIIINFSQVNRVNAIGQRKWLLILKKMAAKNVQLEAYPVCLSELTLNLPTTIVRDVVA